MKFYLPQSLLVASCVLIGSFAAFAATKSDLSEFYSDEDLAQRKSRTAPKLARVFREQVATNLGAEYRSSAKKVRVEFPLRSEDHSPLGFYSKPGEATICIPISSIQFFDDLCICWAWQVEMGYGFDNIFAYLGSIRQGTTPKDNLGRPLPPLTAMSIPATAIQARRVEDTVDKMFGSAIVWIMGHELAHVVFRDPGYWSVPAKEAQAAEMRADAFATDVMRRLGVVPVGITYYFLDNLAMEANRYDFQNEADWNVYAQKQRTHPLTKARLVGLSQALRNNPSDFARVEPEQRPDTVIKTALLIEQIGLKSDDPSIHGAIKLLARRSGSADLRPAPANSILSSIAADRLPRSAP
jgi:hypothetical protein